MATNNKNFKVKNGLDVAGSATFGGTVSVATPTSNEHAATKAYVDANSGGGSAGIDISDTAPESPSEGDLWLNSTNGRFYTYYDSYWIEIASSGLADTGLNAFLLMGA